MRSIEEMARDARAKINGARQVLIAVEEAGESRDRKDQLRDRYKSALVENWLPIDAYLSTIEVPPVVAAGRAACDWFSEAPEERDAAERKEGMSEMIERVARALFREDLGDFPDDEQVVDRPSGEIKWSWRDYQTTARAAIAAMREPTGAMEAAIGKVADECNAQWDIGPDVVWKTMVDAALAEADQ